MDVEPEEPRKEIFDDVINNNKYRATSVSYKKHWRVSESETVGVGSLQPILNGFAMMGHDLSKIYL
jgi:hypothetical protein